MNHLIVDMPLNKSNQTRIWAWPAESIFSDDSHYASCIFFILPSLSTVYLDSLSSSVWSCLWVIWSLIFRIWSCIWVICLKYGPIYASYGHLYLKYGPVYGSYRSVWKLLVIDRLLYLLSITLITHEETKPLSSSLPLEEDPELTRILESSYIQKNPVDRLWRYQLHPLQRNTFILSMSWIWQ